MRTEEQRAKKRAYYARRYRADPTYRAKLLAKQNAKYHTDPARRAYMIAAARKRYLEKRAHVLEVRRRWYLRTIDRQRIQSRAKYRRHKAYYQAYTKKYWKTYYQKNKFRLKLAAIARAEDRELDSLCIGCKTVETHSASLLCPGCRRGKCIRCSRPFNRLRLGQRAHDRCLGEEPS